MVCDKCGEVLEEGEELTEVLGGDEVCDACLDSYYTRCEHCDEYEETGDMYAVHNGYVCSICYENYRECDCCGDLFHYSDMIRADDENLYCPRCLRDVQPERVREKGEHQSDDFGDIIKSTRTFGIELELLGKTNSFINDIKKEFAFKSDGSLNCAGTKYNNTFEMTSPVLRGKKGEESVKETCGILSKADIGVNKSCGFHVHLGAQDFLNNKTIIESFGSEGLNKIDYNVYTNFFIPASKYTKAITKFGTSDPDELIALISNNGIDNSHFKFKNYKDSLKKGFYYVDTKDSDFVLDNNVIVVAQSLDDNVERIKNLLRFYLIFESVIFATQPKSRREGNSFTAPINKSFALNDINCIDTFEKFESYWYKTEDKERIRRSKQDKYSSARYFSFNFHSLLAEKGFKTLEIRLHSGTKNALKVLYWVNLHQTILDKISSGEIDWNILEKFEDIISLNEKMEAMFSLLELDTNVEKFFRKRIKKFGLELISSEKDEEDSSK